MTETRLRVFEIANRTRREVYVAATMLAPEDVLEFFSAEPPRMLRHWQFEKENIAFFEIDSSVPESQVREFVDAYDRATPMPGWTIMHAWRDRPRRT
jgi:hypothetical protein